MRQEPVVNVFSYSGPIAHDANATIVSVPTGFCVVIDSVSWKRSSTEFDLKVGTAVAFSEHFGDSFALGGGNLYYGASGEDVTVVGGGSGTDCYLQVSGILVPASNIDDVTS